jgi:hypothetical protein
MKSVFLLFAGLLAASAVHAESPMFTDDAGTLAPGQQKLEFVWQKDAHTHQPVLAWGISPLEHLELGLSTSRGSDSTTADTARAHTVSVKWVPLQTEQAWSAGLRWDWSHETTQSPGQPDALAHGYALTALASYRQSEGGTWHLNWGKNYRTLGAGTQNASIWALGYDHPLGEKLTVTAEIHGQTAQGPDKALGLRYEIREGLKLSGALGRGNERQFGQLGLAWEY